MVEKTGVLKLGTTMKVIEMDKSGLDNADADPVTSDPFADDFNYKSRTPE